MNPNEDRINITSQTAVHWSQHEVHPLVRIKGRAEMAWKVPKIVEYRVGSALIAKRNNGLA